MEYIAQDLVRGKIGISIISNNLNFDIMKLILRNSELVFETLREQVSLLTNVSYVASRGWHNDNSSWTYSGATSYVAAAKYNGADQPIPIPQDASIIYYSVSSNNSQRKPISLVDNSGTLLLEVNAGTGSITLSDYPTATAIYLNMSDKDWDTESDLKTYVETTKGQYLKYR